MAEMATASQESDGVASDSEQSDGEDILLKARNLLRRITAARSSPHPRFLHNLSAILEQEESRFQKESDHPVSNSVRSAHTIGKLTNMIRENDEFYDLLSSKLLVEKRHSVAVQAAAARLLLACLSCGMFPEFFEDTTLANIKEWAIEEIPGSMFLGNDTGSGQRSTMPSDQEMLKTYSLGLLHIALAAGGGIIEEVLSKGLAVKLLRFLRLSLLKDSSAQKDGVQSSDNRGTGASTGKIRDELRGRVRLPTEIIQIDQSRVGECSSHASRMNVETEFMDDCFSISEDDLKGTIGQEPNLEKLKSRYDVADIDTDCIGSEKTHKRDKIDGKFWFKDQNNCSQSGRVDDLQDAVRAEQSKVGGEFKGNQGKQSGSSQNIQFAETLLTSHGSEQKIFMFVGGVDISVPAMKAADAAQAEAKAAGASQDAIRAAGEAATDIVHSAAVQALNSSVGKDQILAAAESTATSVVQAAFVSNVPRNEVEINDEVLEEEENSDGELEVAQLEEFVLSSVSLANLREKYSVQCLERLGEYLEVLGPVLHERGVDVCLALLQRESSIVNATMLTEVLKLVCSLAAHRRFSALFVDKGGVQQILGVPTLPHTYTGISLCLFAFASVQGVMERVCAAPLEVVNKLVRLALHLLECAPDTARRNAALFFGAAFVFRVIIECFDAQDGLCKMLNLLRNAATIRSGGGSGVSASNSNSTEVLTSSEKQIAYHTCVALRQYFRAHLVLLVDSLRLCKSRSGLRNAANGRSAYKSLDISNEAMDAVVTLIQRDRKLGTAFVKTRWPILEKFMNNSGHLILLELTQVAPGERYLHDIAQHALGVLQIVTLMPNTRKLVANSTLSNERSGMAVVLDAASATGYAEPEVIQLALLVLVNLVCPPPSVSKCPVIPHATQIAPQQQNSAPATGSVPFTEEVSDQHGKNYDNISEARESAPEKHTAGSVSANRIGCISPAPTAVVGDRRICLGSAAGGSALAAFMEQAYRQARDAVRSNNGIKVLLHLLHPKTVLSPTSVDCIRALACKVLLGLARDDAILHILTKLQVAKLLSELLRDGTGDQSRGSMTHGTGDQSRWQAELAHVSMELITVVTNAGRATTLAATDAAAPTLCRIERAAIASATPISYPARELLQLIHEHLVLSGLPNTAATLLKEAKLVPLPSLPNQKPLVPNQVNIADNVQDLAQWPSGRVSNGFLVGDILCRNNDVNLSSRRKRLSFSSALTSNQKSISQSVNENKAANLPMDFHEGPDCLEQISSRNSKRKSTDFEFIRNKRLSLGDSDPITTLTVISNSIHHPGVGSSQNLQDQSPSLKPGKVYRNYPQRNDCHAGVSISESGTTISGPNPLLNQNLPEMLPNHSEQRATLDSLVVQYLKHQHRQCPAPITTLPPLSLFHPHSCPEPSRVSYAPLNVSRRLAFREAIPPRGGINGRRRDQHFLYGRFRPLRPCREEGTLLTCTAFLGTSMNIAAASHSGEIRIFDCYSGNLLETHQCHQTPITFLQSAPGDLGSSFECTESLPGHLLLTSGISDARLWNSSTLGGGPLYSFEDCKYARFSNSGRMFAGVSTESSREVLVYDVQQGSLKQTLSDTTLLSAVTLRGNANSIVHFHPSDTLLLWNGVLWDHRLPQAIHRFDQFTDYGGGGFHPAGNEVIINSEVWDLRFMKLLRSIPSLDQTMINFNSRGDIIYATLRRNPDDITSALHPRRSRHPLFSAFLTMDAIHYTDIATTSVDRCVLDLATQPSDSLISVVAIDGNVEMDSVAKLYEVGRRKPTDDDSDPEDGAETEDDEESFAEEAAEEDEDIIVDDLDEDDSDDDEDTLEVDADDPEEGIDVDDPEEDADADDVEEFTVLEDLDAEDNDEDAEAEDPEENADIELEMNDGDDDEDEDEDDADDEDDAIEVDGTVAQMISDDEDEDTRVSSSDNDDSSDADSEL